MMSKIGFYCVLLACVSRVSSLDLLFPRGFKFGAASAAYQVEGGWNASDKAPSVWDTFVKRDPSPIRDNATGDVACDSYHLWRRDVEMLKELGVQFYRFSISWPRLLPTGFPDVISEDGKNYYNNLIDLLIENGIEPMVTLFHMDIPQRIQDLGGWTNPLIVDWFTAYSRVVFKLYADRVKYWLTINEPTLYCSTIYSFPACAPAIDDPDFGFYLCTKFTMLAHGIVYRVYEKEYKDLYHGKISIANQEFWFVPINPEDEEINELVRQYFNGLTSHPIYSSEGGWPKGVEDAIAKNSREQGYPRSRLPPFTHEEREILRGSYDFYALNYYTSRMVRKARSDEKILLFPFDGVPELNAVVKPKDEWKRAASAWFQIYPEGLRKLLKYIKHHYNNPEVIITENGLSTYSADLDDPDRVEFYSDHLEQTLLAIKEDGVNVTGFTAWTLMDNFEWPDGYSCKFGLYAVDFDHPNRTRTIRASGKFYKDLISFNKRAFNSMEKSEL